MENNSNTSQAKMEVPPLLKIRILIYSIYLYKKNQSEK